MILRLVIDFAIIITILLTFAYGAHAANPDEIDKFAHDYANAINNKNIQQMEALLYPESMACLTATQEMKTMQLEGYKKQFKKFHIPKKYRVSAKAIAPSDRLWGDVVFEGKFEYPIRPTHQIQIDWNEVSSPTVIKDASTILEVVCNEGACFQVLSCPKPGAFEWLKKELEATKRAR